MSHPAKQQTKRPQTTVPAAGFDGRLADWFIPVALLLGVAVAFAPAIGLPFIHFDDDLYVYQNPHVREGITSEGVAWAFTHSHAFNWHPLTTLSHLLDCQIRGIEPSWPHLVNILLHALTAVLLYRFLRRLTGRRWASAAVAALFAFHPLRVESVAWVSERKDVLSGLFFVLTLTAYVRYAAQPFSLARYLMVCLLFALALMCKPMVVTLPIVLMILDYWPLRRFGASLPTTAHEAMSQHSLTPQPAKRVSLQRLVAEKIPLAALSLALCIVTLFVQREGVRGNSGIALGRRLLNADVSYVAYIAKTLFPANLSVLYPYPHESVPLIKAGAAILLLLAISVAAWRLRQQRSYLLAGWLWYLVMLLPVIGLVQVGRQGMADRYSYLPQIGLWIMLVGLAADLLAALPKWRPAIVGAVTAIVSIGMIGVCRQTLQWRDDITLWQQALAVNEANPLAHSILSAALTESARYDEAVDHGYRAVELDGEDAVGRYNLGNALVAKHRYDDALPHCLRAVELDPKNAEFRFVLGNAWAGKKEYRRAIEQYQQAVDLQPTRADFFNNLAVAQHAANLPDDALANWRRAVELKGDMAEYRGNLAQALYLRGNIPDALAQWREVIGMQPRDARTRMAVAWALATHANAAVRNGREAVHLAEQARAILGVNDPDVLDTLAVAYAEAGRYSEAIAAAEQAIHAAQLQGNSQLAAALQARLELYRAGRPYRDAAAP